MKRTQLHATAVAINRHGILILGESGSGKSDLALRLIDGGAKLVADDQVVLQAAGKKLIASAPSKIKGLIEARGVGILTLPHAAKSALSLAVRLVPRKSIERLPEPEFFDCLGHRLPLLSLHAFDIAVCAKIRLFLTTRDS